MKKKSRPKKVNLAALALTSKIFHNKIKKSKKGKGSYSRKGKDNE